MRRLDESEIARPLLGTSSEHRFLYERRGQAMETFGWIIVPLIAADSLAELAHPIGHRTLH